MNLNRYLIWLFLMVLFSLNLGAILKKEDPIRDTQTDPITYHSKKEEMKDGPKGAPAPSYKIYEKEKFLLEPPMNKDKENATTSLPKVTDSEEADFLRMEEEGELEGDMEITDWWEEEEAPEVKNLEQDDDTSREP